MNHALSHRVDTLAAEELSLRRRHQVVLSDVSLALRSGEVVSVLGANGAGKSTLLSSLSGELDAIRCDSGTIWLNNRDLKTMSANEQARQRAVLPQTPSLAFDLRVSEVIAMGAYPFARLSHECVQQRVHQATAYADVTHLLDRRYPELSGGEQQRVQFARIIVQVLAAANGTRQRCYMLLDEPTASLDPLHQQKLLRSVHELSRALNIGVLIIVHDVNLAALWSDRIALLCDGRLLECGTPSIVLTAGNLKKAYGVDACIMPHPRCHQRVLVVFGDGHEGVNV